MRQQEHPACDRAGINSERAENNSLRIDPVVDQRSDIIPKRSCVDQDRNSTSADFSQDKARYDPIKETRIDAQELLPEEVRTLTPFNRHSKNIIKEQCNVEASELLERTNKVQLEPLP